MELPIPEDAVVADFPRFPPAPQAAVEGIIAANKIGGETIAAGAMTIFRTFVAELLPVAAEVVGIAGLVAGGAMIVLDDVDHIMKFNENFGPDPSCHHPEFPTKVWTANDALVEENLPVCFPPGEDHLKRRDTEGLHGRDDGAASMASASSNNTATPEQMWAVLAQHFAPLLNVTCPFRPLPDGWIYESVAYAPCKIAVPYTCSDDWFHYHVNELPAGIRNSNYCTTHDITGPARANRMNCLPDFKSDDCRKEFGLDKAEHDRQKEEAKNQHDLEKHIQEEQKEQKEQDDKNGETKSPEEVEQPAQENLDNWVQASTTTIQGAWETFSTITVRRSSN